MHPNGQEQHQPGLCISGTQCEQSHRRLPCSTQTGYQASSQVPRNQHSHNSLSPQSNTIWNGTHVSCPSAATTQTCEFPALLTFWTSAIKILMHIYGPFILLDLTMHFRDTYTSCTNIAQQSSHTHKYAALQYPPPHPTAQRQ